MQQKSEYIFEGVNIIKLLSTNLSKVNGNYENNGFTSENKCFCALSRLMGS